MEKIRRLFIKLTCWLLGHDVTGKVVEKSYRRVSGEMVAGWQYYCRRCQDPDNFPIKQFPDKRNLYRRTLPWRISRVRNQWYGWKQQRRWEKTGREEYSRYLEEQSRIYGTTSE